MDFADQIAQLTERVVKLELDVLIVNRKAEIN